MVTLVQEHPWALVGPWYRSDSIGGVPANGRSPRPILQKYAAPSFVDEFLKEPQRSLKFVAEDFLNKLSLDRFKLVTQDLPSDQMKLFLDAHSRFYLVVCELHCLTAGFPSVQRDKVCQAGFVVRRYRANVSESGRQAINDVMVKRGELKTKMLKLVDAGATQSKNALGWAGNVVDKFTDQLAELRNKKLLQLQGEWQESGESLKQLSLQHQVTMALQGWKPGDLKGTGRWTEVDAAPQVLEEQFYPLYPLIPDPNEQGHSASGKTLWFGVIPTASADVDEKGDPRFDENGLYEARCFVRRHRPCCPKGVKTPDCQGELVWSQPTDSYRLASFYDLEGCGHRAITIRLPDLQALKDQASRGVPANVRMSAPEKSMLKFTTDGMELPTVDGSQPIRPGMQICFFPIPLITIVALFVFRLFLPIVIFMFGLFFMLKIKFCIPPTISFDADLAADLKVLGPDFSVSIQLKLDASVSGMISLGGINYSSVAEVENALKAQIDADPSLDPHLKDGLKSQLEFDDLADVFVTMATDYSDTPQNPGNAGHVPLPTDGIYYFDRVNPPKAGVAA